MGVRKEKTAKMIHTGAILALVITRAYSASLEVPISRPGDIKIVENQDKAILTNSIDDTLGTDDIIEVVNNFIAEEDPMLQLNEQKVELERLRTAELEMCVGLRDQLDQMKTAAEEGESAKRSMVAQQVVLMEAEGKAEEAMLSVKKWEEKMIEAEEMMKGMEEKIDQLEEEAQYHKEQHQLLQDMIEPFKEQLESFEMEKRALMTQSEAAQGEVKKLATQYGSLLGHQNHQQKIQHVVKIKKENVDLKAEVTVLKEQLAKAKRAYARMEERHNEALGVKRFDPRLSFQPQPSKNKENLVGGTPVSSKGVFQTPQGPVPGSKASRHSTGSPLSRVNRH